MEKIMWNITQEENNDIQDIFEKKSAIENLFKIIDKDNSLYNDLIEDQNSIMVEFNQWWKKQLEKHPDIEYKSLWVDFIKSCVVGEC